jgi:hypothetical protein
MNDERRFSGASEVETPLSLEGTVPAQEAAKSALRTEFSVFLSQAGPDSLEAQPVLLWGNHPGRVPGALVRGLAGEVGLPWVEVSAAEGVCLDHVVGQLARQSVGCREDGPLGVALVSDLEHLTPAGARGLISQLVAGGHVVHGHQGRVLKLSRRQVFWVGALRVSEPSRRSVGKEGVDGGASFALLAVGPSATDMLAGVAGPMRIAGPEAEQGELMAALERGFRASAWLLPGTPDDLVAWARAESEPWWPGRRMRAYCRHHGVEFRMGSGAAEALAAEAGRRGGTVDVMEERLRRAMEPVLAALADARQEVAAVEVTPASLALTEAPRLVTGPRRPARVAVMAGPRGAGIERPARTPHSSPDVRLANAKDLAAVLASDPYSDLP